MSPRFLCGCKELSAKFTQSPSDKKVCRPSMVHFFLRRVLESHCISVLHVSHGVHPAQSVVFSPGVEIQYSHLLCQIALVQFPSSGPKGPREADGAVFLFLLVEDPHFSLQVFSPLGLRHMFLCTLTVVDDNMPHVGFDCLLFPRRPARQELMHKSSSLRGCALCSISILVATKGKHK